MSEEEFTVYCPKEKKDVPVWYCTGSFWQGREPCPELIEATIKGPERKAERKCELDNELRRNEAKVKGSQEEKEEQEAEEKEAD